MKSFVYFIVFFSFVIILNSQPRRDNKLHSNSKPIYVESHVVQSDTNNKCYVSFRVPYSNLVFIKDDLNFTSGIVFRVEVTGKDRVLTREFTHDKVTVNNYESTNRNDLFLEGILSFTLSESEVTVNPLVSLDNTQRQVPLRPFKVEKNSNSPIVVRNNSNCGNSLGYSLVNYENSIPFSEEDYQLFFPIYDNYLRSIEVEIKQNDEVVLKRNVPRKLFAQFAINKCKETLVIEENTSDKLASVFIIDDFSRYLNQGEFKIKISHNDSIYFESEMLVDWVDKPVSLSDPKFAFQLLEIMESEDKLDKIFKEADNEYDKAVELFWNKYDPNSKTHFNQLKAEFYNRADYAIKQYNTKAKNISDISDRGKIYIKYGEPAEVDRYYSDKNQITEVWKYMSPKVEFVFVDVTGLGNYKIVN